MPKISVAMSVYNGEKYLREAIESILKQTYSDFEFIICDDASKDNSVEIIKEYAEVDKRIVLVKNETNLGLAFSLNKCIKNARGEYIARMDADDIAINTRFENQLKYLENNPDIAFVCGGVYLINEGEVWGERSSSIPLTKENVFKYQPIAHPSTMIRKLVLTEVQGYTVSPYTSRGQDFDLWCKIYSKGYIGENIGDVVLYYRENKNAYTRRLFKYRIDSFKMKRIWRRRLQLPLYYELYAYKPIIAGLIPQFLLKAYHKKKFKRAS